MKKFWLTEKLEKIWCFQVLKITIVLGYTRSVYYYNYSNFNGFHFVNTAS